MRGTRRSTSTTREPISILRPPIGVHPNKRRSARALGLAKGAVAAALFDAADLFAGGVQLPYALNRAANAGSTVFNPATAWTASMNSSGLTVVQANGFLADRPAVPARSFTFSGTAAADEALGTTAPDAACSLTMSLPTGHSTFGKHYAILMLLEVTNAAGTGPPVNLASLAFSLGNAANLFSKVVTPANASDWIEAYRGPAGLTPQAPATTQTATYTFVMTVRGKNGQPIDCMVRIAAINIIETEATAYGAPTFTAKAYNVARPLIRSAPTMTPASGTYSAGTAINISQPGTCLGGGLARSYEVINELGQVVGACSPAYHGVAAVPYVAQASDVGPGKTLKVRSHAINGFGADFMDSAVRASA